MFRNRVSKVFHALWKTFFQAIVSSVRKLIISEMNWVAFTFAAQEFKSASMKL